MRTRRSHDTVARDGRLQKVLVANRGEIAKRFFQALHEEGIPSVAVVSDPDVGQSWYEFADEAVYIGDASNYTSIPVIITAAGRSACTAIYPGYGFLSENSDFVSAIDQASRHYRQDLFFMGPSADTMRRVGNKLAARALAKENNVPVFLGSESIRDLKHAEAEAARIGYPVLLKLDAGGGGKGMTEVFAADRLAEALEATRRIGRQLYQNENLYLEKLIQRPVHIEVQIFGGLAVGIRKCAVQRRKQKIIEESGHSFLEPEQCEQLLLAAENMARISGYAEGGGAGTVEFLYDADTREFGFLEMNTRLQVEYAVTDQSLGIDLVKWQIRYFDGRESELPMAWVRAKRLNPPNHAIECRIYAEDPESDYAPSTGRIVELDLPSFNGVRCDFGFRDGDRVLPDYDPMIGKIIAQAPSRAECIDRLERALQELYVKGVSTNAGQLLRIVRHAAFLDRDYTNLLLSEYPELERGAESDAVVREPDRRELSPVIFGAFSEYIRMVRDKSRRLARQEDIEAALNDSELLHIDPEFQVEYRGAVYRVAFVQRSLNWFYTYTGGQFTGRIGLARVADTRFDYFIRFGHRSLRIRADHRSQHTVVRLKDHRGKIQYHRMRIRSRQDVVGADLIDTVRAPFQGTFVKFAGPEARPLATGDFVRKGDPLIVLSAMKMETTIFAGRDGRIAFLLEGGDADRLRLGTTADGRIIGKSLSEGEVLAVIESVPEEAIQPEGEPQTPRAISAAPDIAAAGSNRAPGIVENLYADGLKETFLRNPNINLTRIVRILDSYMMGFIPESALPEELFDIIQEFLSGKRLQRANSLEKHLVRILLHYINIRKVFSPVVASDMPHYVELGLYISRYTRGGYKPSETFERLLQKVLAPYRHLASVVHPDDEFEVLSQVFFFIYRAHSVAAGRRDILRFLISLLGMVENPHADTRRCLQELSQQEMAGLDDSLVEFIRPILQKMPSPAFELNATELSVASTNLRNYSHPLIVFGDADVGELLESIEASLFGGGEPLPLAPAEWPETMRGMLEEQLGRLQKRFELRRLYSPSAGAAIYSAREFSDPLAVPRYVVFAYASVSGDAECPRALAREIWRACVRALEVQFAYQFREARDGNWLEVLVDPTGPAVEYSGESGAGLSCWELYAELAEQFPLLRGTPIDLAILRAPVVRNGGRDTVALRIRGDGENLLLDLLTQDPSNPYYDPVADDYDAAAERLFLKDKWPVSLWMSETFDPDSGREIVIESIDRIADGDGGYQPVGARLYDGTITGARALFFMKDSRVRGGATGNLEGLKYVAAAYLAYQWGCPLYVWNDGAGANIKEGVISLNRAAQGFMLNALLSQNVTPELFRQYVRACPDERTRDLLAELDRQFDLAMLPVGTESRPALFTVAVGIGSSAGLDVYGSSQATLQVLLDSEQSYRVLTGSNVIRSVTGEDLTNYEIGGARIMGRWTGIADFIARDKLHLIAILRRLHGFFAQGRKQSQAPGIRRVSGAAPVDHYGLSAARTVIGESVLQRNVDHGLFWHLKQEYYGAGGLLGGVARLGGHRAVILGLRTHFGIRTAPATIRAREILRLANRTGLPRILIFGNRWFQQPSLEDRSVLRARLDFLSTLHERKGPQINIVSSLEGLQRVELHAPADAVIYIQPENAPREEIEIARRSATFLAQNYDEAFDVTCRILELLAKREPEPGAPVAEPATGNVPGIPAELNQPYDIVESVIQRVLDRDSFLEFYGAMNDPASGPSLVTGLGRLYGRLVGVIADQPAIMGGAPDAPGTEKFRIFTEFLNRNQIPLLMLSNAPGFVPGTRQERLRIQAIGAESLDANVLGQIPVVSLVLHQNYGGRQIHAFSRYLRPGIVYMALDHALIAVMGGQAAFDLFEGRTHAKLLADGDIAGAKQHQEKFLSGFRRKSRADHDAQESGVVDRLIDNIADLRRHLSEGLELAIQRCAAVFGRDAGPTGP